MFSLSRTEQSIKSGFFFQAEDGIRDGTVTGVQTCALPILPWPTARSLLPRMADFALWATACETAFWPAGTFTQAYQANRRAAIESVIDTDPLAACVREIMADCDSWTGSASDLLRAYADRAGDDVSRRSAGWPRNPRALAGKLRRMQTFLRTVGIEIAFSREGRAGTRTIHMSAALDNSLGHTVSTVSGGWDEA